MLFTCTNVWHFFFGICHTLCSTIVICIWFGRTLFHQVLSPTAKSGPSYSRPTQSRQRNLGEAAAAQANPLNQTSANNSFFDSLRPASRSGGAGGDVATPRSARQSSYVAVAVAEVDLVAAVYLRAVVVVIVNRFLVGSLAGFGCGLVWLLCLLLAWL